MKAKEKEIVSVNVYMPATMKRQLEQLAKEQNRSLSSQVVYFLQRMVESVKLSRGAA